LLALLLAGCGQGVLDPKGPVGAAERTLLIDSVAIMLAIVVPTIAATLGFAWWFRASNNRALHLPDWAFSGRIELVTWSVPLLTIMLLGGVAYVAAHDLDPYRALAIAMPPLEVQVVSLDWKWLFLYPRQGIASVNALTIPAGRPVHFTLTSSSVMNAFFIPQLGSMIYTMSGMASQLNLSADHPGRFHGLSAHLSGDGFSDMHFEVRAVTPEQFDAWVAATRRGEGAHAGGVLDPAAYTALAVQSVVAAPFTYRDVDPALFSRIVSLQQQPGPGPHAGRSDITVYPQPER
jgi:cytochrome o ubiquinol oxidase subunit 2